jgi:RNA polymerase sigma-70 factor (ECF subfamily)
MSVPFKRRGRPSPEDDDRITRLYQDTNKAVLAFLLRRCATAEDAADCLAETYRIAWQNRNRVPTGQEARGWVFGIARNIVRAEWRRSERRSATSQALAFAAETWYADPTPEHSRLTDALAELKPIDQEIVMMLSADGLAPREVAAALKLSPNVVRVRAHRARERLRQLLAETDPDSTDPADCPAITTNHGG